MYTFMDSFQKIDSNTNSSLPTHGSLSTGCRDFMNDREVNPKKYIAPKSWYKYGSETVRPYKIRIHPPYTKDEKKLRRYYESKPAALPDFCLARGCFFFLYMDEEMKLFLPNSGSCGTI